ncbi:hypothetical protein [Bacillus sp. ISL-57]|uniref:hypothetical protein n=1 Tax=Bacillus sp. ISL-57 TaxID=2819135 RepID=UPI001BE8D2D0|nr:hypothetical protein [Bacillus sp. ISL-57]MBT2718076.1 hypothetical protein [Bacillus sp. ISL-57]
MKDFTASMPFLIFFITGTFFFHMLFGAKMTEGMLYLVLASMAVMNSDKIKNLLGKVKFE